MGSTVLHKPVLFLKSSISHMPKGSLVLVPSYCQDLHHELELSVLISSCARTVAEAATMDYMARHALWVDMTTRNVQNECKKKGLPWTLAKSFTSSCPISAFVSKEKIPDPHALKLWLKVNGEHRQEGETSPIIFSIPYVISSISKIITLEEGDLILTRAPKGVGSVKENDEMEAGIDTMVSMRFKVKSRNSESVQGGLTS